MTCDHAWDASGEIVVLEESESYVLWEETEFCDICLKAKVTEELGDKDIDGDIVNIKLQSQIIRPQTAKETEDAVKQ